MTKVQKTTLNLPEDLHSEAKAEAARQRMSLTELVIRALQAELARIRTEESKRQRR
jgi:predicted HicB family RNase H-like nuclease